MAFPIIAATAMTNGAIAATSHLVALPAGIAVGDLLLIFCRVAQPGAIDWPAGWIEIFEDSSDGDSTAFAWRKADGTGGDTPPNVVHTLGKLAAVAWRITGAIDPIVLPPEVSALATGNSTTPDPGNLVPTGGAKDYLWLWLGGWQGEQGTPAGTPTNYSTPVVANTGTAGPTPSNCRVATASRSFNAVSEDPGSWTISVADAWSAWTAAIHPTSALRAAAASGEGSLAVLAAKSSARSAAAAGEGSLASIATKAESQDPCSWFGEAAQAWFDPAEAGWFDPAEAGWFDPTADTDWFDSETSDWFDPTDC